MVGQRPRIKLTYADYRTTPDDKRYELLDGELIMAPAPRLRHQEVQSRLGSRLSAHVESEGLGKLYFAPTDVVLSNSDVVQPDLLYVSNERSHVLQGGDNVQGAPDLVIEILSPFTAERDRVVKRALYAQHGVREYWIVGVESATVTVLRLEDSGFEVVGTYGEGDTFTSSTLPEFTFDIDEVFEL